MTITPLTPQRVPPREPGAYAVALTREWEPLCEGVEARYVDIWGAGEWAQVVVEIREVKGAGEAAQAVSRQDAGGTSG